MDFRINALPQSLHSLPKEAHAPAVRLWGISDHYSSEKAGLTEAAAYDRQEKELWGALLSGMTTKKPREYRQDILGMMDSNSKSLQNLISTQGSVVAVLSRVAELQSEYQAGTRRISIDRVHAAVEMGKAIVRTLRNKQTEVNPIAVKAPKDLEQCLKIIDICTDKLNEIENAGYGLADIPKSEIDNRLYKVKMPDGVVKRLTRDEYRTIVLDTICYATDQMERMADWSGYAKAIADAKTYVLASIRPKTDTIYSIRSLMRIADEVIRDSEDVKGMLWDKDYTNTNRDAIDRKMQDSDLIEEYGGNRHYLVTMGRAVHSMMGCAEQHSNVILFDKPKLVPDLKLELLVYYSAANQLKEIRTQMRPGFEPVMKMRDYLQQILCEGHPAWDPSGKDTVNHEERVRQFKSIR
jgi:hypothetical protein